MLEGNEKKTSKKKKKKEEEGGKYNDHGMAEKRRSGGKTAGKAEMSGKSQLGKKKEKRMIGKRKKEK